MSADSGTLTPKSFSIVTTSRIAVSEVPPSAKKSSCTPTSGTCRSSASTPASARSRSSRGATRPALTREARAVRRSCASSRFPLGVSGSAGSHAKCEGTM